MSMPGGQLAKRDQAWPEKSQGDASRADRNPRGEEGDLMKTIMGVHADTTRKSATGSRASLEGSFY